MAKTPVKVHEIVDRAAKSGTTFTLEWIAAPRPPVHPNQMTGKQAFASFDDAITFMSKQPEDARFVSLHTDVVITKDVSEEARIALDAAEYPITSLPPIEELVTREGIPPSLVEVTKESDPETLSLKWGTLKRWQFNEDGPAFAAFQRYAQHGISMSAAMQKNNAEQKLLICEIIDALNADTVYLDWDGIDVSKEEAKKYVMEYRAN